MKDYIYKINDDIEFLPIYEPGKPIEEVAREIGIKEDIILKLASNENPLGPSPAAIKAMHFYADKMNLYPDGGAFFLRRAIAKKLGIAAEEILVTNGSNEAIELLAHVFLRRGVEVITGDRAFIIYKLIGMLAGAQVKVLPMPSFKYDINNILGAITECTRIIFIGNPNNPTGTMLSQHEIAELVKKVPDDVIICFDEAYIELIDPKKQPDTISYVKSRKNVVILRTFSKTYGLAGLRIGYIIAPSASVSYTHLTLPTIYSV